MLHYHSDFSCILEFDFDQFPPNLCSQMFISGGNLVVTSSSNFLERSSSHQLSSGEFLGMCIFSWIVALLYLDSCF